jgi:F-type H+-transporting ATPase subunit b
MFVSIAAAAETAAEHQGGIFSDPETWVAITWLLVVGFLAPKVFRSITAALDLRREKIRSRIEEAERLCDEAQELLANCQKKQRDALHEAEAIIAHAKAETERLARQSERELDDLLKRREQQAIERIDQAKAEVMRDVRNAAVDIAIEAARKLIAETLPAEKAGQLVDAAIKDLPNRLH